MAGWGGATLRKGLLLIVGVYMEQDQHQLLDDLRQELLAGGCL
jgi:hypothetical protein